MCRWAALVICFLSLKQTLHGRASPHREVNLGVGDAAQGLGHAKHTLCQAGPVGPILGFLSG